MYYYYILRFVTTIRATTIQLQFQTGKQNVPQLGVCLLHHNDICMIQLRVCISPQVLSLVTAIRLSS